jgi:hypothetical protein
MRATPPPQGFLLLSVTAWYTAVTAAFEFEFKKMKKNNKNHEKIVHDL